MTVPTPESHPTPSEAAEGRTAPPVDLPALAAEIVDHLRGHFPAEEERIRQVLALAEEVGEFVGAYRRASGMARRTGDWADVEAELADVVITAYVTAHVLGIDVDTAVRAKTQVLFTRGWRDQNKETPNA